MLLTEAHLNSNLLECIRNNKRFVQVISILCFCLAKLKQKFVLFFHDAHNEIGWKIENIIFNYTANIF